MMATAKQKTVKKAISHFFTDLRRTSIALKGKDLIKMQLTPGPIYRQVLAAVLDAKLDGELKTKKDEIEFARHYLKRQWFSLAYGLRSISQFVIFGLTVFSPIDGDFGFQGMKDLL